MPFSMGILRALLAPALVLALMASGCLRPPPLLDRPFPPECRVGNPDWDSADSIRVAHPVTGALDEERFLASWVYATPVYVDCNSDVRAGFADEWVRHDGGRRWTLFIRSGLRFTWGEELTADAVASRWRSRVAVLDAGVDSVVASGNHVDVYFRSATSGGARILADNAFGLRLQRWPAISLRDDDRSDLRDLLESGVDIMITLDSDVVDYARRHEHFTVTELPYDRVYVLMSRSRLDPREPGHNAPGISRGLQESLAADAVRSSARAADSDLWWDDVGGCDPPSETVPWRATPATPSAAGTSSMQIGYEVDDPIARAIAERIVALAAAGTQGHSEIAAVLPGLRPDVQARGISRPTFEEAFAYIVALPLTVADPCVERLRLIERVHWLLPAEDHLDRAIVPLVEARRYAIFRNGAPPLAADCFGNVRVAR